MRDIGIVLQDFIEAVSKRFTGIDRSILRQRKVNEELRAIRRRKELTGNERKCQKGCNEKYCRQPDCQPLGPHRQDEEAPIRPEYPPWLGRLRRGRRLENHCAE